MFIPIVYNLYSKDLYIIDEYFIYVCSINRHSHTI